MFGAAVAGALLAQQQEKKRKVLESLSNPSLFAKWLSKFEQMGEIGKRGLSDEEPLIKFLYESTGCSCWILDNTTLYISSVTGNFSLPSWVTRYLTKVTDNGNRYGDPVTATDCLNALDLI